MKTSAGILLWRRTSGVLEVLLAHPGGPFFAKKDEGSWSIPKGEYDADVEDALAAARREFLEETGQPAPASEPLPLGTARQASGKVNTMWALEGDLDVTAFVSNHFEMTWPPGSGKLQSFPEMDRAGWFALDAGMSKIFKSQRVFLERLDAALRMQE